MSSISIAMVSMSLAVPLANDVFISVNRLIFASRTDWPEDVVLFGVFGSENVFAPVLQNSTTEAEAVNSRSIIIPKKIFFVVFMRKSARAWFGCSCASSISFSTMSALAFFVRPPIPKT